MCKGKLMMENEKIEEIYTHKDLEIHQTTEHVFPRNEFARAKIKEEYLIMCKIVKEEKNKNE